MSLMQHPNPRLGRYSYWITLLTAMRVGSSKMIERMTPGSEWKGMMPIILTIALQTVGLVWWTATTSTSFEQRIAVLERSTISADRMVRLETTTADLYRRFDRFETKLDALFELATGRATRSSRPLRVPSQTE